MSDAPTPSTAWSRGRRAAFALVLLVQVSWAYGPAFAAQFVYDDQLVVLQNPAVAQFDLGAILSQPLWAFHGAEPERAVGYWRPLASTLLAVVRALFGPEAWAFHAAAIALHAAASLAAWALARRITRHEWVGFAVGLLFAVHPVHVESTAWISAIGDPAFGLCVLLALERHLAWRERGSPGVPWAAVLCFAAGLAAKELAAGFLVAVVALDLTLGRRERGVRAWIPYALTFAAYVAARMVVFQSAFAGFDRVTTDFGVGLARLVLLRVEILGLALRYAFLPVGQRVFHPFAPDAAAAALGIPLLLFGGWCALAAWLARRGERRLLAALVLVLAPLGVIVVRVGALGTFPFSERYLYLPVFGAVLFAALIVRRLVPPRVAAVILVAVLVLLADATRRRTRVWQDEETLFRAAAAESPRSPYARWLRGRERLEAYRSTRDVAALRDAETEFVAALDLLLAAGRGDGSIFAVSDDHVQANVGRGWVLLYVAEADGSRDFQPAATVFRLVTERYPTSVEAWTGLGVAQMELGDLPGAEGSLKKAIEIDPGFVAAHRNLGRLRIRRGDWPGARAAFEDALRRESDSVETLVLLGTALERGGDDAGARSAFDRAARLAPRDPRPRVQRAILDAKAGRLDAALAEADAVLVDAPEDGEAHLVRGKVLLARGEKQRALLALRRACDLLPLSYEAHYNAGALALELEGPASALPELVRAYENRPRSEPGTAIAEVVRATGVAGPGAYVQLATADADRGERDSALAWIDLALARDANHGPAHFLRGGMKFEKGDREGARTAWTRAVELMPDSFPAREALAGVLLELGDREGALREYREAVRILEKLGADPGQVEVVRARVRDLESEAAEGR